MRIALALALAAPAYLACDPGRPPDDVVSDIPAGDLDVFPTIAFTGVEIGAEDGYTVPAIQHLQPLVTTWTAASDKIVIHDQGDGLVVLEATGAGETTITASAEGKDPVELPITITEYPAGSASAATADYYTTFDCAGCHDGEDQPDVTSSGIAEHSDEEVLASLLEGTNPEDGTLIDAPGSHVFALDDVQRVNLMAFLRWQASKTLPTHDH